MMSLTYDGLLKELKARVHQKKTQRALAEEFGVSPTYLGDILSGRRQAGPTILKRMGYERITITHYKRAKA